MLSCIFHHDDTIVSTAKVEVYESNNLYRCRIECGPTLLLFTAQHVWVSTFNFIFLIFYCHIVLIKNIIFRNLVFCPGSLEELFTSVGRFCTRYESLRSIILISLTIVDKVITYSMFALWLLLGLCLWSHLGITTLLVTSSVQSKCQPVIEGTIIFI